MTSGSSTTQSFPSKPRVFIVSDISNEPDDAESLVRYLLYSNQFETKGLVACTSTWMKRKVCPQDMEKIIHGYAKAVENLNAHAHPDSPYPSAEYLLGLVKTGPSVSRAFCPRTCTQTSHEWPADLKFSCMAKKRWSLVYLLAKVRSY